MKTIRYPFFKTFLIGLWFSLIFLLVYGSGVGLHYRISPLLILLSCVIIAKNKGTIGRNLIIKIFIGFIVLAIITSYHYYFNWLHRTSYLNYLCYSISGYIIAITSYSIVKNDRRMVDVLFYLMIVFFIVGIFRFFRASSQLEYLHANTAYYYILMPLPLLLLKSRQHVFHIIILLVSTVLCILSVKRGAIISIAIVWLIYFLSTYRQSKKSLLYACVLLLVGGYILSNKIQISNFAESSQRLEERFLTIEEDGGSGRTGIIESFFKQDFEDLLEIPEIFIGKGFEGTYYKYRYLSSFHNDFLEVTYSYGLIGFFLLIGFYIHLFRKARMLTKKHSVLQIPYMSMSLLFLIFSFVGCNFNYFNLSVPLFLSLGVLESMTSQPSPKGKLI